MRFTLETSAIDQIKIFFRYEIEAVYMCTYASPILIAPSAFHRLAHIDGEVAIARGATKAQCIYIYNWMLSTIPEEKVLETTGIFKFSCIF